MILVDRQGHLVSDCSFEELNLFADKIGLKRKWYQSKKIGHYDLTTKTMINKAVKQGAQMVSSKEIVKRALRQE
jgi:hypothetical protein